MLKSILTQIAPEFNTPCLYYLDCIHTPITCVKCKLKGDMFVNMSIQRALQIQTDKVLKKQLDSYTHRRMKEVTTAGTMYVLPLVAYRAIQGVKQEVTNKEATWNQRKRD